MLGIAGLVLVVALVVLWLSRRQRVSSGLPAGRIIYSDTNQWGKVEKPLYDPISGLTGRPDYMVEEQGKLIPVEVKSRRAPEMPYDSHIYQLAAYCLLVERTTGKRPPYGIIHYNDRTFSVEYTEDLQRELEQILDAIHSLDRKEGVDRSHQEPGRCARCGYRNICDQRL